MTSQVYGFMHAILMTACLPCHYYAGAAEQIYCVSTSNEEPPLIYPNFNENESIEVHVLK